MYIPHAIQCRLMHVCACIIIISRYVHAYHANMLLGLDAVIAKVMKSVGGVAYIAFYTSDNSPQTVSCARYIYMCLHTVYTET